MTFQKTFPKNLKTTNTSKPDTPDFKLDNPLKAKSFVVKIEIIPNFRFAEKGKVFVEINDISVFDNSDVDNFYSDVGVYTIPISNNELRRSNSVKVFVWNGDDSDEIAADVSITISNENILPVLSSVPIGRDDKIRGTTDQGTKTTADGSPPSGIVSTVYTCPTGKKARVLKFETRAKVSGSAGEIRLLIRGQRILTWKNDTQNPNGFQAIQASAYWSTNANPSRRTIWSDGLYPDFNLLYEDLKDEELDEGETIAYDGDFSGDFNATIDFAYTILETKKI